MIFSWDKVLLKILNLNTHFIFKDTTNFHQDNLEQFSYFEKTEKYCPIISYLRLENIWAFIPIVGKKNVATQILGIEASNWWFFCNLSILLSNSPNLIYYSLDTVNCYSSLSDKGSISLLNYLYLWVRYFILRNLNIWYILQYYSLNILENILEFISLVRKNVKAHNQIPWCLHWCVFFPTRQYYFPNLPNWLIIL